MADCDHRSFSRYFTDPFRRLSTTTLDHVHWIQAQSRTLASASRLYSGSRLSRPRLSFDQIGTPHVPRYIGEGTTPTITSLPSSFYTLAQERGGGSSGRQDCEFCFFCLYALALDLTLVSPTSISFDDLDTANFPLLVPRFYLQTTKLPTLAPVTQSSATSRFLSSLYYTLAT